VLRDPRSNASAEVLQQQFALVSQLSESLEQVSIALRQAKDLRKQIDERKKDPAVKRELIAALEAFNQKMEIAAEPDSDNDFMLFGLALPDKAREPLPRIQSALTGLLIIEQSADVAPSADVVTAANAWNTSSNEALARWKTVLAQDLAAVNFKLRGANLKPLGVN